MNNLTNFNFLYHYALVKMADNNFSDKTLSIINQTQEIHIYFPDKINKDITIEDNQKIFIYVFTEKQYLDCIQKGYIPHICFYGKELLTSPLLKYINNDYENFWFPTIENINEDNILKYSNFLNKINIPICVSISDIFNPEVNNEQSRQWIEKLHLTFSNPLKTKEEELLSNEIFNENNIALFQENNVTQQYSIILGLFGDCIVKNTLQKFQQINIKNILTTKPCKTCDIQEYCLQRGLGYLKSINNYNGCIGIKLLN